MNGGKFLFRGSLESVEEIERIERFRVLGMAVLRREARCSSWCFKWGRRLGFML